MDIKVSTENGRFPVTIMHIEGDLDATTYVQFQKKANELIKNGARHILVDFAQSPYVSSAGLRAIHQLFKDLNSIHPDATLNEEEMKKGISEGTYKSPYVKLLNLSEQSKFVFNTSGFNMYIEYYDDLKTAIAAF
jgi:anti-anti-sigma factor